MIAKGTALLVSIPTSLAGTISNRHGSNPVDVRAGLILGVTAAATSVPAVYVAVALPPAVSAMTFAVLLIAIAIQLIIKAVHAGRTDEVPAPRRSVRLRPTHGRLAPCGN